MKSMMKRTTLREVRQSFGRYVAILAIIALGVGFYAGLTVTKSAMVRTTDQYLKEQEFFDYRLLSTLGFEKEDEVFFREQTDVKAAEGAHYLDVLADDEAVVRFHSITQTVNRLRLQEGRMPKADGECVVDAKYYPSSRIGTKLVLSEHNDADTLGKLTAKEFTIVGRVQSPSYMNFERGTTSLGNGKITAFIYLPEDSFDLDYYTEIYVEFDQDAQIYSDAYQEFLDERETAWEALCDERAEGRYRSLVAEAQKQIDEIEQPDTFILGRETNLGYACFENDSNIVAGIARVFPVFFFLVAALVCITTMNRMVEEQRTQIGVLKALGYGKVSIMGKYMFYSGSSAMIGCIAGFFLGTYGFPKVIWTAYGIMYDLVPLQYVFDGKLFIISIFVSLLCSIGTTWFSCRYELEEAAAQLMRPKAPKAGKRVIFEKIPFIWKRIKFLHKVSVRNIFRYKKRFFMMILGISGCTALLVTGFGIKDSISNIASYQYDEIMIFDGTVSFDDPQENTGTHGDAAYLYTMQKSVDLHIKGKIKPVNLVVVKDEERLPEFIDFHTTEKEHVSLPEKKEALINGKLASSYNIKVGDEIRFLDDEMQEIRVTVSGIFENYIYDYVFINEDTYRSETGRNPEYKSAYVTFAKGGDVHEQAASLMKAEGVASVSVNEDMKERIGSMMSSLDYIVVTVIICAAVLAFIVLYNLTNINITERIREIATIKVLGFYKKETAAYVFRENMVLTGIGTVIGLFLGKVLHAFVIGQIRIDMIAFDVRIKGISYVFSILLTFLFAWVVNLFMSVKIDRVNMAESLKSVD